MSTLTMDVRLRFERNCVLLHSEPEIVTLAY